MFKLISNKEYKKLQKCKKEIEERDKEIKKLWRTIQIQSDRIENGR